MTTEGQAAMSNALIGRTFELLTELATMRLEGGPGWVDASKDVERRLDAQILNLTVREARLVMEIAGIIEEKLP